MATYSIDTAHSGVHFSIKHLGISAVRGEFHGVTGTLDFDAANPAATSLDVSIDVSTISTRNADRDNHLKSPDFFDVAQFPTIAFKASGAQKISDAEYKITGDLTIHGVTKAVTLDVFDVTPEVYVEMFKVTKFGANAKTTINRKDFGLTFHQVLETGALLVGDEVKIELELEFNKN